VVGGGVVGGGVVGGGVVLQVQVGVGLAPAGAWDCASAECEANITVKLVAASVMLANPAILARLFSFNVVTRCLLSREEIGCVADSGIPAGCSCCHRARDALASHFWDTRA
jgi:hypothetical protein